MGITSLLEGKVLLGVTRSEDFKRVVGEKNRINMTGKKIPEKTRKKMSESHKKIVHKLSPNFLYSHKGRPISKEQKEYLSKINTGENNPTHKYSNDEVLNAKKLIDKGLKTKEISQITRNERKNYTEN